MFDTILSLIVYLIPRWLCIYIWNLEIPLGPLAPHILGRCMRRTAHRIDKEETLKFSGHQWFLLTLFSITAVVSLAVIGWSVAQMIVSAGW